MTQDAKDFLATVLWLAGVREKENEPKKTKHHIRDCTIFDVHQELVTAVEVFCAGFRNWLEAKGFDVSRLDLLSRSFGGSVYLSLSGHGAGFFDEYLSDDRDLGDDLQALAKEFGGSDLRFHELESMLWLSAGAVHLAIKPLYRSEYLRKMFGISPLP